MCLIFFYNKIKTNSLVSTTNLCGNIESDLKSVIVKFFNSHLSGILSKWLISLKNALTVTAPLQPCDEAPIFKLFV